MTPALSDAIGAYWDAGYREGKLALQGDDGTASKALADLHAAIAAEVARAVEAERERCAKVCQQVAEENACQASYHWHGCMDCKAAIEGPNPKIGRP